MEEARDPLSRIRLLILDVDGVLTDGRIVMDGAGEEIKSFHVRDGLGIRMLLEAGVQVGIITGRSSAALRHRCLDLGIPWVFDGVTAKGEALVELCRQAEVPAEEAAFIGDDLPDLPLMGRVGLPIAVADAHEEVRSRARMVTRCRGGEGAVREVGERILRARGSWEAVTARYRK